MGKKLKAHVSSSCVFEAVKVAAFTESAAW